MKNIFEKLIKENGAMYLLGNSACPCGELSLMGITIKTHCWRSTREENHSYSCVHISQDEDMSYKKKELKEVAQLFAKEIEESYCTKVSIKLTPNT